MSTNSLTTCCESSSRTLAETGAAASAQTPVYCPVYESRLLATARHELNSAAALGVYGGPYAGPQGYGNYVTYGTEAPPFYSLVSRPGAAPSLLPVGPALPRAPGQPRARLPGPRPAAVRARRSLLTATQLKLAPDELPAACGGPARAGGSGRPRPGLQKKK